MGSITYFDIVEKLLPSAETQMIIFNRVGVNDYGSDCSIGEKTKRNAIKGGAGQKGEGINRNDNFGDEDQSEKN